MTLPELAALAAERVPGLRRSTRKCEWCGGVKWGNRLEPCDECDDNGRVFDDSPAALLMAVVQCADLTEVGQTYASCSGIGRGGFGEGKHARTPESIARAALVAFLRAHGVEVGDEH